MDKENRELRQFALTLIREQVLQQFQVQSTLDNKASWLLGFLAIVFTIFFSTQGTTIRTASLYGIGILLLASFAVVVVSVHVPIHIKLSPGVRSFKKFLDKNIEKDDLRVTITTMLSEDNVQDFEDNQKMLSWKKGIITAGYVLLLLALVWMFAEVV